MLTANDDKVHHTFAGDMWMLGMLVYQVMTGEPYWTKSVENCDVTSSGLNDDFKVLQILSDPRRPLPHEHKSVLNVSQQILENLLHRDPGQRLTSSDLIQRLEQDLSTGDANTISSGPVVYEQSIVLDGT